MGCCTLVAIHYHFFQPWQAKCSLSSYFSLLSGQCSHWIYFSTLFNWLRFNVTAIITIYYAINLFSLMFTLTNFYLHLNYYYLCQVNLLYMSRKVIYVMFRYLRCKKLYYICKVKFNILYIIIEKARLFTGLTH